MQLSCNLISDTAEYFSFDVNKLPFPILYISCAYQRSSVTPH
jgi:hypothetical protein